MSPHGTGARRTPEFKRHVDADAQPGWLPGVDVVLHVGDRVFCTEGIAQIVRILGKTGDGSRLLELQLPGEKTKPFFAAASNVLVAPADSR